MKTWILAGAIAFAATGSVLGNCEVARAGSLETAKLADVNIGQIKGQLKLTAAQLPLWARVEEYGAHCPRASPGRMGFLRRVGQAPFPSPLTARWRSESRAPRCRCLQVSAKNRKRPSVGSPSGWHRHAVAIMNSAASENQNFSVRLGSLCNASEVVSLERPNPICARWQQVHRTPRGQPLSEATLSSTKVIT